MAGITGKSLLNSGNNTCIQTSVSLISQNGDLHGLHVYLMNATTITAYSIHSTVEGVLCIYGVL